MSAKKTTTKRGASKTTATKPTDVGQRPVQSAEHNRIRSNEDWFELQDMIGTWEAEIAGLNDKILVAQERAAEIGEPSKDDLLKQLRELRAHGSRPARARKATGTRTRGPNVKLGQADYQAVWKAIDGKRTKAEVIKAAKTNHAEKAYKVLQADKAIRGEKGPGKPVRHVASECPTYG